MWEQAARRADERRRAGRRRVERLLELARHLPEPERTLIEQVYQHGLALTEVARRTGRPPRTVQRRVANLLLRLRQPLYVFLVTHRRTLPRDLAGTCWHLVVAGRSERRTAAVTRQSLHRVRRHRLVLSTLARAAGVRGL